MSRAEELIKGLKFAWEAAGEALKAMLAEWDKMSETQRAFAAFIASNRQTGSTTAIVDAAMARTGESYIVVSDYQMAQFVIRLVHKRMADLAITATPKIAVLTVSDLKNSAYRGMKPRTVFIDTTALCYL